MILPSLTKPKIHGEDQRTQDKIGAQKQRVRKKARSKSLRKRGQKETKIRWRNLRARTLEDKETLEKLPT
jgi:very-short-patch-repair endonuclease